MAFTIDKTYFENQELLIANANDASILNNINVFIAKYEPQLLEYIFGYDLYEKYKSGIIAATQKYIDIRDGKEYVLGSGVKTKWKGLKHGDAPAKVSLIANYVYYWYHRANATSTTSNGEKRTDVDNAQNVSMDYKLARAWSEMADQIVLLRQFLLANTSLYPEYVDPLKGCRRDDDRVQLFRHINPNF